MTETPSDTIEVSSEVRQWCSSWLKKDASFIKHEARFGKSVYKALCTLILRIGQEESNDSSKK